MKFLQDFFDKLKPFVEKGGKYEKYHTLYEGHRTIVFAPDLTTGKKGSQVKDAVDLKRMMFTVIIAMIPCLLFGMWNVGHQHFLATGVDAELMDKILIGALKVVPIIIVSYAVGLGVEFVFCVIRQHPVSEGFLVSGLLIPLVMPATIPLWQVALATVFAVVIGKEAFGGTGMNILNVALVARAFLY
ncbi:MAG: RnfABCDGE type electron transport complex subunit D, partial [Imperialibacter sp.]